MRKLLFVILFLTSPLFATSNLPYQVDQTNIMENFEFLYTNILSLDNKFILNASTQAGFTQFYVTSGTVTDFLSVPGLGTRTNVDLDLYTNGSSRLTIKNGGEVRFNGNGVVTTPILSWGSDTNLGIFRRGIDVLGFAANGGLVFEMAQSSVTSLVDFYTTNLGVASILSSNGNTAATVGTQTNPVITVSSPMAGPSCASGFTRSGTNECNYASGYITIRSSGPTGLHQNFNTLDIPILNSTKAKVIHLRSFGQINGNGDGTLGILRLYFRTPGSGAAADNNTTCYRIQDHGTGVDPAETCSMSVVLDSNKDVDFSCSPEVQVETSDDCVMYVEGYSE